VAMREAAGTSRTDPTVATSRLTCSTFWVDVRLREINGALDRIGRHARRAEPWDWVSRRSTPWKGALEPFEDIVGELLASVPRGLG
jgi:hypothetical protein